MPTLAAMGNGYNVGGTRGTGTRPIRQAAADSADWQCGSSGPQKAPFPTVALVKRAARFDMKRTESE